MPLLPRALLSTLLSTLVLAFAAAAQAQAPDPADLLIDNIAAHETLMPNLAQLCDDIGPRMTGTPALRTAQRWAMDKLRAYGAVDVHTETYAMGLALEARQRQRAC
ncbi:hypothetical protein LP419_26765 [Massilia sp. H-1]|nr:hypothetical protein LP419_26765 [Massilia sp. H-1]